MLGWPLACATRPPGQKGPAELGPKRVYTFKHVVRIAADLGYPGVDDLLAADHHPGVPVHHVVVRVHRTDRPHRLLVERAEDMGLIDNFMGVGSERGNYIGHSIGLEVDEWPVLGAGYREPLPVGAVITIEPKFMVPGQGAVMVEDDIVVTPSGHEVISTLERELFVP